VEQRLDFAQRPDAGGAALRLRSASGCRGSRGVGEQRSRGAEENEMGIKSNISSDSLVPLISLDSLIPLILLVCSKASTSTLSVLAIDGESMSHSKGVYI
jgi:hypothetical protein